MYFNSKITHSVIKYLESQVSELESLYDLTSLSPEILRDQNTWLESEKVEAFLVSVEGQYRELVSGGEFYRIIGHKSPQLKAWGVLDSVLKMMPNAGDLFAQPQRLFSYFVSPAPPINNVERLQSSTAFDLPLSANEYPMTCEFLAAAFESLPGFIGKEFAQVKWFRTRVSIDWNQTQSLLLDQEQEGHQQLNPEFVQNLLVDLGKNEAQMEKLTQDVREKEIIIDSLEAEVKILSGRLKGELEGAPSSESLSFSAAKLERLTQDFLRLSDYMSRAQQLVTLLSGMNSNREKNEAMRRLDWAQIREEFPVLVSQTLDVLKSFKEEKESKVRVEDKPVAVNMNEFIESIVDESILGSERNVHVQKLLFFDREFTLVPEKIKPALSKLVAQRIKNVEHDGFMRVVVRPKGQKVELEFSDTFTNSDDKYYEGRRWKEIVRTLSHQKAQLKRHSSGAKGTTFNIEFSR